MAWPRSACFLQRSGQVPFERINLTAPSCQLELGQGSLQFTVRDVAGEFLVDTSAPALKLAYRVPGAGAGTRCELTLTRDRRTEQIETSLVFKTVEGMPLPARVLNVFFDADDWLGTEAKVEGTVSLRQEGSRDWEARLSGRAARCRSRQGGRPAFSAPSADRTSPRGDQASPVGPAPDAGTGLG